MKTLVFENELIAEGFTQIPNSIIENKDLSIPARFLYLLLLKYAWKKNQIFPGQDSLAKIMCCSGVTIRKYLSELKKANLITWKQRGLNKTNIYIICNWKQSTRLERKNFTFKNESQLTVKNESQLSTNNTKNKNTKREREKEREIKSSDGEVKEIVEFSLSDFFEEKYVEYMKLFGVTFKALETCFSKYRYYSIEHGIKMSEAGIKLWLKREKWQEDDLEITPAMRMAAFMG